MKELTLISVAVSNLPHGDDDNPQNNAKNIVIETVKEAWGLYVQYRRTINEATNYWEDEIKAGLSNGKYISSLNNRQYSRIKIIFNKLVQSLTLDLSKHNWRIYLHTTDEVNAFTGLDGIIIINRGIIDFCQNNDELALTIGHEMAHMTEGHVKKQLLAEIAIDQIIEHVASFIAKKKNKRLNTEEISDKEISDKEFFQLIFNLTGKLALLKYSRLQEEKADKIGAMYAANVGYDTVKGYDFWKRMASISNDSRWTAFLSTHPYSEQRANTFLNDSNTLAKVTQRRQPKAAGKT
jgi:predicted Zn-dependent protease